LPATLCKAHIAIFPEPALSRCVQGAVDISCPQFSNLLKLGWSMNPRIFTTSLALGGLLKHPIEDDTITTIPEPSSLALCAIGFAGLIVVRRSPRPRCS
jgi:hypothetical protein